MITPADYKTVFTVHAPRAEFEFMKQQQQHQQWADRALTLSASLNLYTVWIARTSQQPNVLRF